jgi:hypothetical protein
MFGDTIDDTYNDATKMVAAILAAARCSAAGTTEQAGIIEAYIGLLPLVKKAHQQRAPYKAPPRDEGR